MRGRPEWVGAARRFVWYPEDIRIVHRGRALEQRQLEQPTSWAELPTQEEDEHTDPLDMAQCWRDGCYHPVPTYDTLGLCPPCVAYLRTL